MLVSTMIDDVLAMTSLPDTEFMGDKRAVILKYISSTQRDWAKRTERFTKTAYCYTRATGGEDAQSKYSLAARPELAGSEYGLPYDYISVQFVLFDEDTPLEPVGVARYLALKQKNTGRPYYGDPKVYWIRNNVLYLWPVPNTVAKLRVFYSAYPKEISEETEYLVTPDTNTILHGVAAMLFNHLRDFERAVLHQRIYEASTRQYGEKHPVESGSWSPYASVDDPQAYVGGETGQIFL